MNHRTHRDRTNSVPRTLGSATPSVLTDKTCKTRHFTHSKGKFKVSFARAPKRYSILPLCKLSGIVCKCFVQDEIVLEHRNSSLGQPWPSLSHNRGCGYLDKVWSGSHGNKQDGAAREQKERRLVGSHLRFQPSLPLALVACDLDGGAGILWTSGYHLPQVIPQCTEQQLQAASGPMNMSMLYVDQNTSLKWPWMGLLLWVCLSGMFLMSKPEVWDVLFLNAMKHIQW